MRLFCFHHAGGNAAMFRKWDRALRPAITVVAVELPERSRFRTFGQLVAAVDDMLAPELNGPYAFFGHSFGAMLAYRLTCARIAAGHEGPAALFISSIAPPSRRGLLVSDLADSQLATVLSHLGGIGDELDDWPDLKARATSIARDDLRLLRTDVEESDDDGRAAVLHCPINALVGEDDPLVNEADLQEWSARTTGPLTVRTFPGGHFYLSEPEAVQRWIKKALSPGARSGAAC